MGLPLRCVALDANGGYDTHDGQAATLPDKLGAVRAVARRLPGRPRGPRPGRPGAHARVVGVRPPRRSRTARAPTTARPALSFLIGTQVKGTMVGEFPGLATLDAQGNLRNTSDFRARLQARRAGLAGRRRDRDHPRRGAVHDPAPAVQVRRTALLLAALLVLAVRGGRGRRQAAQEAPQAAREGRGGQGRAAARRAHLVPPAAARRRPRPARARRRRRAPRARRPTRRRCRRPRRPRRARGAPCR